MSETTTEKPTVLVPEGKDLIRSLTVAELDMASRRVGADINEAVDSELRWTAFPVLAEIWARRSGDERREPEFRKLDMTELLVLLGLQSEAAQAPEPPAALGGNSGEAPPEPALDPADPSAEENPTDSAAASS